MSVINLQGPPSGHVRGPHHRPVQKGRSAGEHSEPAVSEHLRGRRSRIHTSKLSYQAAEFAQIPAQTPSFVVVGDDLVHAERNNGATANTMPGVAWQQQESAELQSAAAQRSPQSVSLLLPQSVSPPLPQSASLPLPQSEAPPPGVDAASGTTLQERAPTSALSYSQHYGSFPVVIAGELVELDLYMLNARSAVTPDSGPTAERRLLLSLSNAASGRVEIFAQASNNRLRVFVREPAGISEDAGNHHVRAVGELAARLGWQFESVERAGDEILADVQHGAQPTHADENRLDRLL